MPIGGMTRRSGPSTGSVIRNRNSYTEASAVPGVIGNQRQDDAREDDDEIHLDERAEQAHALLSV